MGLGQNGSGGIRFQFRTIKEVFIVDGAWPGALRICYRWLPDLHFTSSLVL